MNAELEELKTILASEKQFSELGYASKYKELGSKKVLLPVATLLVMFSLQVNDRYFLSRIWTWMTKRRALPLTMVSYLKIKIKIESEKSKKKIMWAEMEIIPFIPFIYLDNHLVV